MRDLFKSLDAFTKIKKTNRIFQECVETGKDHSDLTLVISYMRNKVFKPPNTTKSRRFNRSIQYQYKKFKDRRDFIDKKVDAVLAKGFNVYKNVANTKIVSSQDSKKAFKERKREEERIINILLKEGYDEKQGFEELLKRQDVVRKRQDLVRRLEPIKAKDLPQKQKKLFTVRSSIPGDPFLRDDPSLKHEFYNQTKRQKKIDLVNFTARLNPSLNFYYDLPLLTRINRKKFPRLSLNQIKISLASPEQIKKWCSRLLPTGVTVGEIKNAQTIHYKTYRPIPNGLFCQQIFGPTTDFTCACGKIIKKKDKKYDYFCAVCHVEFTKKRVRRYNLGYIKLNSPVTHIWFLRGRVSYISILLGYKRKQLEELTFCQKIVQFIKNTRLTLFFFFPLLFPFNWCKGAFFTHNYGKQNNSCFGVITPQPGKRYAGSFYPNPPADPRKEKLELFYKLKYSGHFNFTPFENWKIRKHQDVFYTSHNYYDILPTVTSINKNVAHTAKVAPFTSKNRSKYNNRSKIAVLSPPLFANPEPGFAFWFFNKKNEEEKMKYNPYQRSVQIPVKTFLQPTVCPYLPTIASQEYDNRLGKVPLFYYKSFNRPVPVWDDLLCLIFFTVLPEKGDIPIPDYSQLTSYPKNKIFEHDSLLGPLAFHKKHLANAGGSVIKKMLKSLNIPVMAEILKKIIFKVEKEYNKLIPVRKELIRYKDMRSFAFQVEKDTEEREFILEELLELKLELKRLNNYMKRLKNYQFKKVRCAKITRDLIKSKVRPEWMTLSTIPVLPPELRPILILDNDQLAISDLNKIYQNIFYRNARFTNKYKLNSLNMQSLLQKAVDALIDNGKGGYQSMCASNGRPLKSLSDILKGKEGLFRQNLLGKRVDYSGRSVIIVGPSLKLYQCGLPKEMAVKLFHVFLIRDLIFQNIVNTTREAKQFIEKKDLTLWSVLEKIMQKNLVILNRAPTLHRLGIQAFQPKLVNGRAILLHPLVCTAFNADFDGDQMAVHIPLSKKAQAEARFLMWSTNNIVSPATGQPIAVPSQDMILGCNYLTYFNEELEKKECEQKQTKHKNLLLVKCDKELIKKRFFSGFNDLLRAYHQNQIFLHAPVWVKTNHSLETELPLLSPLETRINRFGELTEIFLDFQLCYDKAGRRVTQYLRTTPGRVIVNQALFG